MKKFISSLALLMALVFSAGAQTTQIATLSHNGEINSYSSANALRQAYEAAADGDVITLSSGSFNSVDIEKRITVRGAGMGVKVNDTGPYIEPTILVGDFKIATNGDGKNNLVIEGILCESRTSLDRAVDAQFTKCNLYVTAESDVLENVTFINCVFPKAVKFNSGNSTINFHSCYFYEPYFGYSSSLYTLTNCILESRYSYYDDPCVIRNSIYYFTDDVNIPSNNGTVFNSIWSGNCHEGSKFFKTLASHNNTIVPEGMKIFKEGTFYQLTDEAKKYPGSDGTEVGIYGGTLPFDPTPTNPQIIKFNVAPKTTADGKLSIDIEVMAK